MILRISNEVTFLNFCGFEQLLRFCINSSQNLILCRMFQEQLLLDFTDNVQILIFHVWSGIAREGKLGVAFQTYETKELLIRNTWAMNRVPFVCFTQLLKPKYVVGTFGALWETIVQFQLATGKSFQWFRWCFPRIFLCSRKNQVLGKLNKIEKFWNYFHVLLSRAITSFQTYCQTIKIHQNYSLQKHPHCGCGENVMFTIRFSETKNRMLNLSLSWSKGRSLDHFDVKVFAFLALLDLFPAIYDNLLIVQCFVVFFQ